MASTSMLSDITPIKGLDNKAYGNWPFVTSLC